MPCISPERLALLQCLEAEFYALESAGTGTTVTIGVATGADDIFITTDPRLVEPARPLPLAMAGDLLDCHARPDTKTRTALELPGHYRPEKK